MARNAIKRVDANLTNSMQPPNVGGTFGVPSSQSGGPAMAAGRGPALRHNPAMQAQAQMYVVDGPPGASYKVVFRGQGVTAFKAGKLVSATAYDIPHLQRQGIPLRLLEVEPGRETPPAPSLPEGRAVPVGGVNPAKDARVSPPDMKVVNEVPPKQELASKPVDVKEGLEGEDHEEHAAHEETHKRHSSHPPVHHSSHPPKADDHK